MTNDTVLIFRVYNDDFGIESVNIENKFIAITISGDQDQTYNATLADGSPLPSGFVIDSKTGTITGTLPEGVEELDIIIQASGKEKGCTGGGKSAGAIGLLDRRAFSGGSEGFVHPFPGQQESAFHRPESISGKRGNDPSQLI